MKGQNLPAEDHIVRLVSYSRLEKDADGNAIGLLFTAFQRQPDHDGLSVTWVEYFGGNRNEQIEKAVRAIRASKLKPGKKAGYAIGQIGSIKDACASRDRKIRIIHWPAPDNKAHAEIRQLPRDDISLLERLAANEWSELILESVIPEGAEPAPDEPVNRTV